MRVLAIDTALEACSAAMLDTAHADVAAYESLPMARGHAEALIPLIARVMHRAGLTFAELDRIAVTTGPGSFTGLRVGISAARGIGLAAAKPVVGLSTLAAYASPFIAADDTLPVVAAVDALQPFLSPSGLLQSGEYVDRSPRIVGRCPKNRSPDPIHQCSELDKVTNSNHGQTQALIP